MMCTGHDTNVGQITQNATTSEARIVNGSQQDTFLTHHFSSNHMMVLREMRVSKPSKCLAHIKQRRKLQLCPPTVQPLAEADSKFVNF